MAGYSQRREKRLSARKRLNELMSHRRSVNIVHYVCDSLDKTDGSSPRVVAIATKNIATGECQEFSLHLSAEGRGIGVDPVLTRELMDDLERDVLRGYFSYLRGHRQQSFVHWNMRDNVFGFRALEHRARVLKGVAPFAVPSETCYDLAVAMADLYGRNYTTDHPRLAVLARHNGITTTGMLLGKDEPENFMKGRYRALHISAARKRLVIEELLELTWTEQLKTQTKRAEIYGTSLLGWLDYIQDTPVFSIVRAIFAVIGLIATILTFIDFFR